MAVLVLLFLSFAVYANSLGNWFVSDDVAGILQNPAVGDFSHVLQSGWGFFEPSVFFIVDNLFGKNPAAFRLINIGFHAGNSVLVFILGSLLSGGTVGFITAALFAVHPLASESVTWISGATYNEYAFFSLLSLICFVLASRGRKYLYFSLLFFGLALASSEKAIILPVIILALFISFWPRFNSFWPWLLVFFAGSGTRGFLLLSGLFARVSSLAADYPLTNTHFNSPFLQIPIAITTYLNLIFYPEKLTLYHSDLIFSQQEFFIRVIILAIILLALAVSFFKNKQIFFWGSFFLISLLPTINPYVMAWVVAERYVYFGMIGILAIVAIFLTKIFRNKNLLWVVTGILVLALSIRTIWRNFDWQSEDTLWPATAKYSLLSPQNHNNLGDYYGRHGDFARSAQEFQTAIDLLPGYADAYHNLGNTYLAMGKLDLALESYKTALKYRPSLWQSQRQIEIVEKLIKKEKP